ncbi:MAG: haloacid dehalogenase-like hydrolase [Acidobacteria bacterium]|nr:haloacid dehalogenase-like hydrolase [Acidobacteriota bacterium]
MSTAHPQNVIALIWDFDKTVIPGYMQDPIFEAYSVDGGAFWREVNALPGFFKRIGVNVHPDTCYLNHLLTYVNAGRMGGLTNGKLRELGKDIVFHEGLPDFFRLLKEELDKVPEADRFELKLEHYIVSTGLREMIEGSAIRPFVDGIWASEFIETPPQPGFDPRIAPTSAPAHAANALLHVHGISQIAVAYDNTSKTRAIFEINKGSNVDPTIEVNATLPRDFRRVPFEQMIYIADGPSDVPAFSVLKQNGGTAYAVYDDAHDASLEQVERLREDGRVHHYGPADYRPGSPTAKWLGLKVRQIAAGIVERKKAALKEQVGAAPRHLG